MIKAPGGFYFSFLRFSSAPNQRSLSTQRVTSAVGEHSEWVILYKQSKNWQKFQFNSYLRELTFVTMASGSEDFASEMKNLLNSKFTASKTEKNFQEPDYFGEKMSEKISEDEDIESLGKGRNKLAVQPISVMYH